MAAIDPSAPPSISQGATTNGDVPARATLKIIRSRRDLEDGSEGESDDEEDYLKALLGGDSDSDDESQDSDEDSEEENGGPSDPERTKKAREQKEKEALAKMLAQDDDEMDVDKPNGVVNKGKAKATGDEPDTDEEEEEEEELDIETYVLCTLDPTRVSWPLFSQDVVHKSDIY